MIRRALRLAGEAVLVILAFILGAVLWAMLNGLWSTVTT